jgi:dihydroorotate dehydrogenase (fumarate)
MLDLTTTYLGLKLKNPLVASSGPLCKDVSNLLKLEDAGASAVVLHSLFEEQINVESNELDHFLTSTEAHYAEHITMFPDMTAYNIGPDGYLAHIRKAKQAVDIPIIGSLNGVSTGGWIRYAKMIEEAGADALELNIYYMATNFNLESEKIEKMYTDLVSHVKASVSIPVAVKLGPYFSAFPSFAKRLDECGADGLVMFNRFYQPDFDLENLEVTPNLVLSHSNELLLRLHWVALTYGKIKADMAITGGVHTAEDVIKSMMAGARVAMMTSALLRHGPEYLDTLQTNIIEWMMEHEYTSIREMQGSMSARSVKEPAAFERANYMKVLSSYVQRTIAH